MEKKGRRKRRVVVVVDLGDEDMSHFHSLIF